MTIIEEVRRSVQAKLQDDAHYLGEPEVDDHIQDAVRHLSLDKPLMVVQDLTGDGTADLKLPDWFEKGFSYLENVESPAGENPPVNLVRDDDWYTYEDPSKPPGEQMRLRFRLSVPPTGTKVRITYAAAWTLVETDADTNLDRIARQAVVYKALVFSFRAMAAKFSQSQDPTIEADAVDYGGRPNQYLFQAERYETEYRRVTGLSAPTRAAQAMTDVDIVFAHGEDFVWHPVLTR